MRVSRFWLPVLTAGAVTSICLGLGLAYAALAEGPLRGNSLPLSLLVILLPYMALTGLGPLSLVALVVQALIYGRILDFAHKKGKRARGVVAVMAIHGFAITAVLGPSYAKQDPNAQLIRAVKKGDVDTVKSLLDKGADPNTCPEVGGPSLLILACRQGDAQLVELLLDKGAAVKYGGGAVLFQAVLWRQEQVVQLLLDKGADIAIKDSRGETALDCVKRYLRQRDNAAKERPELFTDVDRARLEKIISLLEAASKARARPSAAFLTSRSWVRPNSARGKLIAEFGRIQLPCIARLAYMVRNAGLLSQRGIETGHSNHRSAWA